VTAADAEAGSSASASSNLIWADDPTCAPRGRDCSHRAASTPHAAAGIGEIWHRTQWGQSSEVSLQEFGGAATRLPKALDFGDSYADVVLPSQVVGGVPMVVFFQMDKTTHGLKRIQLERPRHGVNREVDSNFQFRAAGLR
jgi:hypothetical protein